MHKQGFIHRDIKPSNILLGNNGVLKLADFGLSKSITYPHVKQMTKEVQTLWYRSPEVMLGNVYYTTAIDVWSVGAVIYEMLTGKVLF